ncbi:MAG: site-2 protease family protein [Candidatus Aminicenantes bacterium]|nr:MAG: site-2 protease family protein [Candidatus Aminicenantes bacterium]
MFGKTVTLFRVFGFEIKVDWSWLILGALIVWSLAKGLFPAWYKDIDPAAYWAMGVAGALGLFISIVFHELCHSLVARRYGVHMRGITLFLFGGVAEMGEEPASPKAEFFLAVAGPISSIVLAAVLLGLSYLLAGSGPMTPVTGVLNYLGYLNFVLAGFNLIPAFPLDGGRILRAVLWGTWNDLRRATRVAASVGAGLGAALMVLGALQFFMGRSVGGLWTLVIGMFVRGAARSSYRQLLFRRALEGVPVRKFMAPDPVTLEPSTSVEKLVEDYIYKYHHKLYPVVEGEKLVGCVTLDQVKELGRGEWASHNVGELARGCSPENTIGPDEDVMKALALMQKTGRSRLVVADGGMLAGVIALKDIMGYIALKLDLEEE